MSYCELEVFHSLRLRVFANLTCLILVTNISVFPIRFHFHFGNHLFYLTTVLSLDMNYVIKNGVLIPKLDLSWLEEVFPFLTFLVSTNKN